MATTFQPFGGPATTSGSNVYACPAGAVAIVVTTMLANTTSNNQTVTVTIERAGRTDYLTPADLVVPANGGFADIGGKHVLSPGDTIRVTSETDDVVYFTGTVQERT